MASHPTQPSTSCSSAKMKSSKKDEGYGSVLDCKKDKDLIQALKHIDTFYVKKPEIVEGNAEERPEDAIPDEPQNSEVRDFLSKAPKKGLWMPLGKEVKVMQCWKCKAFGHRSGDKECPLFLQGCLSTEQFRFMHEDPMFEYVKQSQSTDKDEKVKQLEALLRESTSEEDSSDEDRKKKKKRKKDKKHKKSKKRRKDKN